MKKNSIIILMCLFFLSTSCTEDNPIPKIPLTLNPVVLANPISVVASSNTKRLYLVNSNNRVRWVDASFIVYDISNPIVPVPLDVISIKNFSGEMILDEGRGFVYIPNRDGDNEVDEDEQVLRINIDENSTNYLQVDNIASAENPYGAFFDGVNLYVAATAQALRYNVDDFSGFTTVDLEVTTDDDRNVDAEATRQIAISPSGKNIFVTNEIDNMLILNAEQFIGPTGPGRFDLGDEPVDYVVQGTLSTRGITRDSEFIYVVDAAGAALKIMTDEGLVPVEGPPRDVFDTTIQVGTIPLGTDPNQIVLDEVKRRAYVTNTGDDTVSILDIDLQQEIGLIDLSTQPADVEDEDWDGDQVYGLTLVNIDGVDYLYVTHFLTNLVSIINADTLEVVGRLP